MQLFAYSSALIALPVVIMIIGILAALLILGFEIAMFIDLVRNPRITQERKILWAIGMVLLHPIVAIVYYFTDRKPD